MLKFQRDRERWLYWLFEAKNRFNLSILNYTVTHNHIHLLVQDDGTDNEIPRAMQLLAGRTAQEYNNRKGRHGAFWEDRYHATAIESGNHLKQCLLYIDLNMVRAGAVEHPEQWPSGGYCEGHSPRQEGHLLDQDRLVKLFNKQNWQEFQKFWEKMVSVSLDRGSSLLTRDEKWSGSIAVGSEHFVSRVKQELGARGWKRELHGQDDTWHLKERRIPYQKEMTLGNELPIPDNVWLLETSVE
jgi:putative transposase